MQRQSILGQIIQRFKRKVNSYPWTYILAPGSTLYYDGQVFIKNHDRRWVAGDGTSKDDRAAAQACSDGGTIVAS